MMRRSMQLVALGAAVAVAIGAGTLLRHQLSPSDSDPVAVAEAATEAYATGDCEALRTISVAPASVDCAAVTSVRDAYRAEGLEPDTFAYEVVAQDDLTASVRITYERDGQPNDEVVELERSDEDAEWLVLPVPLAG